MQVWGTPDWNGWIRTIAIDFISQFLVNTVALPLSYVPLQGGRPCQSISEKPPAFMPLASIVFYNDISDINDIFT